MKEITYSLREIGGEYFSLNVIQNGRIIDILYGKLSR